jgi:fructokinase
MAFSKVIGIGEVLWDMLPTGKQMGGAPANFAFHARQMGADGSIISRVGDDALGRDIIERLFALGVPTCSVSLDAAHPTGTVEVELAADGQPRYIINEDVAWDYLAPQDHDHPEEADAICFGTLAQRSERSRAAIRSLLSSAKPGALRIFDVNLRQHFYSREVLVSSLQLTNVLKLNDAELPILADLLELRSHEPKEQLRELAERHALKLIAYTRGANGSWIYDGKDWSERPGIRADVKDTIGAGDAFTAAVTVGMLLGWPIDHISEVANRVAAFVCSQEGGTPQLPDELRQQFQSTNPSQHVAQHS